MAPLELVLRGSLLVKLDSEAWTLRRKQVARLVRHLYRKDVGEKRSADSAAFLDGEVVGCDVQMQARGGRDG